MVGIMLHELGHLGQVGYDWLVNEHKYFKQDFGASKDSEFYKHPGNNKMNDYNIDNESFANDYAKSVADVIGYDLLGYNPTYGYVAVGGFDVYQSHHQNIHNSLGVMDHFVGTMSSVPQHWAMLA